ncbi:hypothetical protein D7Z26_18770 [Cohnella endophytica]|uniref:CBM6 domain-containing protein n=1 Tax=Cohnella endophytica TaxID=2419778 RepID=A0A494XP91_9BACL|nr:hypothetical protein [Cohnella endophytica]RKP49874.1 hypothetical protein D7Z26_18770 [Cohnella endophytica]
MLIVRRWNATKQLALCMALLLAVSIASVLAPSVAHAAATYYVATTGSDSNNGTSLGTPFKTIQKAASVAVAGDTVNIRAGTYRETVSPANNGTSASPIVFQNYSGESVTISGLDAVTSAWTQYSGNIYYTNTTMSLGDQDAVFVDGAPMTYARWPNKTGASPMTNDGAMIGSGSLTSITDSGMPNQGSGYYNGGIVWFIAGAKWTAHGATITGSGSGTVNFTIPGDMGSEHNPGDISRGDRNYYYLAGKLGLLDVAKEWFYDSGTGRLYLYVPGGGSPSSHTVEVKKRVQAIDLTNKSYIQFKGINIKGAEMKITGSNNVIDGMTASYVFSHNARGMAHTHPVTDDGIHITGSNNTIKNGDFGFSDGNVFLIDAGSNNLITNNYIHDGDANGSYDALIRLEDNFNDRNWTDITFNTMYKTGRSAIHFIRPAHFKYNEVYNTNIVSDDGAGIYLGSDLIGPGGKLSEIAYNIVHDVYWQSGSRVGVTPGIYMDGGTYNAVAHHNVVYNIGQDGAFRMNGPSNNTYLYNNTTYNTPATLVANCCSPTYSQDNNFHNQAVSNFVDAANHNFRLVSGSSAINTGVVHSPWTDGYAGSAPDKGAYELGGTDWTAGVNGSAGGGGSGGPTGYTFCAKEHDTCSLTGTNNIAYGGNGIFAYGDKTGSFGCDNGLFGDPAPGVEKSCYYKSSSSSGSASYEAEASGNTLAGGANANACTACSGGMKVGGVGNNSGTLQFNGINSASAGTKTLTIYYTNGDATARTGLMSVNGGTGVSVSFPPTGSFTTVGTVTVSVALNAGSGNTIKFYTVNAGVWCPDFDKINV